MTRRPILLLVGMFSLHASAQVPDSFPVIGTWRMSIDESTFGPPGRTPASGPRQLVVEKYERAEDGFIVFTLIRITGEGRPGFIQAAFKLDGQSYPVYTNVNLGMYGVGETPLTLRGRWTQLDPDTVQITLEDNGQRIPETMTLVVSNDRAAMTKTIERADAQGNQTKDVIAYTSAP